MKGISTLRWARTVLLTVPMLAHFGSENALAQGIQPADSVLSLHDLLLEMRANNPRLRTSDLDAEALSTRADQVSALPDPTVMLSWQPYAILTARGSQRIQLRAEQMFPFPGKLGLQGEIADRSAEVARSQAQTLRLDLELRVKQAYYELYRIRRLRELVDTFQATLADFEEAARTHYEVGTGAQQAILKAQLEKNSLTQMRLDLDEKGRTASEMLARLLNRDSSAGLEAAIRLERPSPPDSNEAALLQMALRRRPELAALDAEEERADAQIALARKSYWPDFGLNVTYFDIASSDVIPSANGRDALAVGASIKVPLQRGRLGAHLDEARIRRSQVDAKRETLETEFRTEIADLLSQMRQQEDQMDLYLQTLIPQAEVTLQATISDYTTGRTDFLNLLDAERMLFSLRTGYENMYARYLKVTAALERAVGITNSFDQDEGP